MDRGWFGILSGMPKSGKTHFALSAVQEANVFLFDTERGSKHIINKHFADAENKITVYDVNSWNEFKHYIEDFVKKAKENDLVIIDSFWDLIRYCQEFMQEQDENKNRPWYHITGQANKAMKKMITFIVNSNYNLIATSPLTDVYAGDSRTGQKEVDLRPTFIHLCDFMGVYKDDLDNWDFDVCRWKIKKQNWMIEPDPYSTGLYEVVRGLQSPIPIEDKPIYGKEYKFRVNPNHR